MVYGGVCAAGGLLLAVNLSVAAGLTLSVATVLILAGALLAFAVLASLFCEAWLAGRSGCLCTLQARSVVWIVQLAGLAGGAVAGGLMVVMTASGDVPLVYRVLAGAVFVSLAIAGSTFSVRLISAIRTARRDFEPGFHDTETSTRPGSPIARNEAIR
jgi:hypothetical protein